MNTDLNDLGMLYTTMRRFEAAEKLLQRCLKIRETMLASNPDDAVSLRSKSGILGNLAQVCQAVRAYKEAKDYFSRSLAISEAILARNPRDVNANRDMAAGLNNLCHTLPAWHISGGCHEFARSLKIAERPLARTTRTPRSPTSTWASSTSQGHYDAAEPLLERGHKIRGTKPAQTIPASPFAWAIWRG